MLSSFVCGFILLAVNLRNIIVICFRRISPRGLQAANLFQPRRLACLLCYETFFGGETCSNGVNLFEPRF